MKTLVSAFLMAFCAAFLSARQVTLAQDIANTGPIRTGFAVITPLTGNGQGLGVSETFAHQLGGNFFQAGVVPSPWSHSRMWLSTGMCKTAGTPESLS